MEVVYGLLALFFASGVGLIIYERKNGPLFGGGRDKPAPQTEADREAIRAESVALNRASGSDGGIL